MTDTSNAIYTLCSHLCVGDQVKPLDHKEWSMLAKTLADQNMRPEDILAMSVEDMRSGLGIASTLAERLIRLIDRNASLSFELSKLENMGINVLTRGDRQYPQKLKAKLGNSCPPLFYCAGDISLSEKSSVGYVGSRTIDDRDMQFAQRAVEKTVSRGFGVVSGGAKGVDSIAEDAAIEMGSFAIAYLSDSMQRKLRQSPVIKAIQSGSLLLLSVANPDAGFHTGIAMMRNRYIYAQSEATVIVRADYNKGGTWSGAVENLRHSWCQTFCWNRPGYKGNTELIKRGAFAIDTSWDGDTSVPLSETEQMSLFG